MSTLPPDIERQRRLRAATGQVNEAPNFQTFAQVAKQEIDKRVGQPTQIASPQRFKDFLAQTDEGQQALTQDFQQAQQGGQQGPSLEDRIVQAEQALGEQGVSIGDTLPVGAPPEQRLQALQTRLEQATGPQAQQIQEFQRQARSGPLGPLPEAAQATAMAAFPIETIVGELAGLGLESGARTLGAPRPVQIGANLLGNIAGGGLAGARIARGGTSEFGRQIGRGNVRTGRSIEPGATGAATDAAGQAVRVAGRGAQQAARGTTEAAQRAIDPLRPTTRAFAAGPESAPGGPRQPVQRGLEGVQRDVPRADTEAAEQFMRQGQLGEESVQQADRLAQRRRPEPVQPQPQETRFQLPDDLKRSRVNIGNRPVEFESDLDRALYIATSRNPSRRRARFESLIRDSFGEDVNIREIAEPVRQAVRQRAQRTQSGPVRVEPIARQPARRQQIARQADEPLEDPEELQGFERLQQQVEELDAIEEAAAARNRQLVRPPWATGMSAQEVERIAQHEGLNPFREDWFDGLDSTVIREAKQGQFKNANDVTLTQIRSQRAEARRQLRQAREEPPARETEPSAELAELDDEQVSALRNVFRDFSDDELSDLLRSTEIDEAQAAAARQVSEERAAGRAFPTEQAIEDIQPPDPAETTRIRQAANQLAEVQPETTRVPADAPPGGGRARGGAQAPPPGGRGTQGSFGDDFGRPNVPEGRLLRDTRSVDTHYQLAFEPTRALRLAQKFADTPVISNVLRAANPASVAKRIGQRIGIARASAVDEANQRVARAASHVLDVGTREQVFGRLDNFGRISEGPLAGRTLNEIAERPQNFTGQLTRQQEIFVNRLKDISQERFNLMRRNGLNVRELRFEDGGEFADRIVLGRRNPDGELVDAQTVTLPPRPSLTGARVFERSRTFREVTDLLEQGYEVLPYDEAVFTNARGAYRRVIDKQVQEWLIRNVDTRPLSEGPARAGQEFQLPQILPQRVLTGRQAGQVRDDLDEAFRREEVGRFARRALQVSQVARFAVLVGDASIFLIQLLKATFRHPNAISRSGGAFADQLVRSLLDPQAASRTRASIVNENRDLLEKMPGLLVGSDQEFTEAVSRGLLSPQRIRALGARGGAVGRAAAEVPARGFEAFTNAFDVAMDTAGIHIARGVEHLAEGDASRISQLEDYVNNIRGMTSSARLGVPARRRVEEGIALLAPRYRRAVFADHVSALQGGLRGSLARRSYAHLVVGLMMTGAALTIAQSINEGWGRRRLETELKEKLNPVSPRFMLWRIGGQNVGPGSKYLSDLRLAGRVITDPESFTEFGDFSKNSGVRWVRGQLGFVPGTAWSVFSGKNYIGERTRPDNLARPTTDGMMALGRTVFAENLTPLWTQTALLEGGSVPGRATRAAGDFFGLRAFPQGSLDILNEESFNRFGQQYENLEPYQKDTLRTDLEDRIGPLEEQRVEQGDEFAKYFSETDKLEQRRLEREAEALQFLQQGRDGQGLPYDRSRFLDDYFDAQAEARVAKTQLQTDMGVDFEEENPDASEPNKQALRAWWDAFDQATSPAGNFNVEAYNRIQQQLLRQMTPEQRSYVLRNSNRKEHAENVLRFLPRSTVQDILRSQRAREQHRARGGRQQSAAGGPAPQPQQRQDSGFTAPRVGEPVGGPF